MPQSGEITHDIDDSVGDARFEVSVSKVLQECPAQPTLEITCISESCPEDGALIEATLIEEGAYSVGIIADEASDVGQYAFEIKAIDVVEKLESNVAQLTVIVTNRCIE